jgi:hypothetical protein
MMMIGRKERKNTIKLVFIIHLNYRKNLIKAEINIFKISLFILTIEYLSKNKLHDEIKSNQKESD